MPSLLVTNPSRVDHQLPSEPREDAGELSGSNALDIAETVRQLLDEGWEIAPEDLAHISPCLTEHINRRVQHTRTQRPARGIRPEARLRLHPLREQDLMAAGLGQAA